MFTYSCSQFQEIIDFMLKEAKRRGATDAVAEVSEGQGLSVTVRKGEVETIEQSLDKQVGVTVFLGHRRGNASTRDFSKASLKATVDAAAFAVSKQIQNSDGASVSAHHAHFMMGTSHGFIGGYPFSRHYISCAPIASEGGKKLHMQRDDWYSSSRMPAELADPAAIGIYAAQRALSRLKARSLSTRRCPVIFEAPPAAGLLGGYDG